MRLASRPKICLYAQVDLQGSTLKPCAASLREMGRLRHLGNAKDAFVELASGRLLAGRHGELHVFDCCYWHALNLGVSTRSNSAPNAPLQETRRADRTDIREFAVLAPYGFRYELANGQIEAGSALRTNHVFQQFR